MKLELNLEDLELELDESAKDRVRLFFQELATLDLSDADLAHYIEGKRAALSETEWLEVAKLAKRVLEGVMGQEAQPTQLPLPSDLAATNLPSQMAGQFVHALQRSPRSVAKFAKDKEQEAKALAERDPGGKLKRREEVEKWRLQAENFSRPSLTLPQLSALWGLHALLRQAGWPAEVSASASELYAACGVTIRETARDRKELVWSEAQEIEAALYDLFRREETLVRRIGAELQIRQVHLVSSLTWRFFDEDHELWVKAEQGKPAEPKALVGYIVSLDPRLVEAMQEQFVNLPPLAQVKAALIDAGATARRGSLRYDLEFVLWLHANPYNPHDGGHHVDWQELAEKIGLGEMLARREKRKARKRLIDCYERAKKVGWLLDYELDRPGRSGQYDRLVKNTEALRKGVLPPKLLPLAT